MTTNEVLSVGGSSKAIQLPPQYPEWESHLLDIDPIGSPDIAYGAREFATLDPEPLDAVCCSRNPGHCSNADVAER
jgi:hypothetical protein